MNNVYVVIIKRREGWEVKVIDRLNETSFQHQDLISLYDDVKRQLLSRYQNKEKVIWLYHFYNQAYLRINNVKKNDFRNEVMVKFNYNIDKLVIVKKEIKLKTDNYYKIWCLNKIQYGEVKEFLKMFSQKLKDEMIFSRYFDSNQNNCTLFLCFDNLIIASLYDEIGLKRIITLDENTKEMLVSILSKNQFTNPMVKLFTKNVQNIVYNISGLDIEKMV